MKEEKLYTCMGCGFKTFIGVFTEREICPICRYTDTSGGCIKRPYMPSFKAHKSLLGYQKDNIKKYPSNIDKINIGGNIYFRNPLWRPIDELKLDKNHSYFPKWKYDEFYNAYGKLGGIVFKKYLKDAQKFNSDDKVHLENY